MLSGASWSSMTRSGFVSRCFFFNDTATTEIYTLSLHDALPISLRAPLLAQLVHQRVHLGELLRSGRLRRGPRPECLGGREVRLRLGRQAEQLAEEAAFVHAGRGPLLHGLLGG